MTDEEQTNQSRRARRRRAEQQDATGGAGDSEESPPSTGEEPFARPIGEVPPQPIPATNAALEENRKARRAAASKRRVKREQKKAVPVGLDAGEMVDDALSRGIDVTWKTIRRHFNVVQWIVVFLLGGYIAWQIYSWRHEKNVAKASDVLIDAVQKEYGEQSPNLGEVAESYRQAIAARPGTPTASLAQIGLAGVLYDQKKYAEAIALYDEVASSKLAKMDPDVKGRAIEGSALALEAKGEDDKALKKFGELANAELDGFGDLARYHQARLHHKKGDDAKAKELLVKLVEKLQKEKTAAGPSYLAGISRELLTSIDPKAVPPDTDEALQKALQQFQKKLPPGAVKAMQLPTPMQAPMLPTPMPAPAPSQ